ncbi:MAG: hypothetical protein M1820_010242 [Bogoriella megaspora]|nr:MAG: hypothetical protein M1820_010242 [Bogoriella megaspora]
MASTDLEKDLEKASTNRISAATTDSCYTEVPSEITPDNDDEHRRRLTPCASQAEDRNLNMVKSGISARTTETQNPAFEVDWDSPDDQSNPQNWSLAYKTLVIAMMSYSTTVVTLYSTSYTSGIPGLQQDFGITETTGILGLTTYLLGLGLGCLISAPMSEQFGRRPLYIISMAFFAVLVLPCVLAKNIKAILISRFFGAIAAAAMISNAPGSINDIATEEYRAFVFSIWGIGPMNGPVLGPLIGGWVFQYAGWRWTNWVVMIAAGVAFFFLAFIKESYAPAILRRKARLQRQSTDDDRWWSRYDEKKPLLELVRINLSRPFVMMVTEPICIFWDIYIAIVYAILYLCFVAYPIVFSQHRGWTPGLTGLAYCGIGVGSLIVVLGEPLIRRIINLHKREAETGRPAPEAQVSIICVGALLIPAGELWFAWTCIEPAHWIWPILAGIPFCMGNTALFIYGNNYILQSYGVYAASALAGNAVLRSIAGATLPLAGPALYKNLGPHWAGTLLGLLELACAPVPFLFYRYGDKIRNKSTLIQQMQEDRARLEGKRKRAERRLQAEVMAEPSAETGAAITEVEASVDLEKGL